MGAALTCCKAPPGGCKARGGPHDAEEVRREPVGQQFGAGVNPCPAAIATAIVGDGGGASPRSLLHRPSPDFFSVLDGYGSDTEEEWHDALSEVDLAEALEEWEEEQLQGHDSSVDAAIKVLKARGHLLPPALEAAARQQRADDMADLAAAGEDGRHVRVAGAGAAAAAQYLAPKPPHMLELTRSRSQEVQQALLTQPHVRKLLARAADLAADGRVLGAHKLAVQAAEAAGTRLEELAALAPGALAGVLPAGASLDLARLAEAAAYVEEALPALDDHSRWMVSHDGAFKLFYRHQRGTTVHSFKASAVFERPMDHVLALSHEFDLIPTWNKFSLAAMGLVRPSTFESYIYGAQWMVKPFKHMQGLLHAQGYDLGDEHRCLLVSLDDCAPDELPEGHKPLPPEWSKRKLVNFLRGSCMRIRPLPAAPDGTPRTEGTLCLHIDPHVPFLPAFLLNFVLGVLAPYAYKQMLGVLTRSFADEQGVYSTRIRNQPHVYGLLHQRLAEFEAELGSREEGSTLQPQGSGKKAGRR